ncbi:DUF559 domain-containing protein [Luedemannella flava]|uniref:DUF559 domain-containing protein n=1 Tax=Luedemannella flava TaxID=349316 RepID=A0ABN2MGF1_9ACTN
MVSGGQVTSFLSRDAVMRLVASGRWQRPHRGVFVAHNAPLTEEQRLWVAVLAVGGSEPALLGGLTALRANGLSGFERPTVHVLLPADRQLTLPPTDVLVHRTSTLVARDINAVRRPPRTAPGRSVVEAGAWARSDREARAIVAAAFQQWLVRFDDVADALERMPRSRRRRLVLATARDAARGATSLGELEFLDAIRAAGLPEPESQHVRVDASGRRRYLDFYFARWHVHVEIDGSHHLDVRQAWADMARQNEVWRRGDRVLRFPTWLVREQPETVVAELRAALKAAGWPG